MVTDKLFNAAIKKQKAKNNKKTNAAAEDCLNELIGLSIFNTGGYKKSTHPPPPPPPPLPPPATGSNDHLKASLSNKIQEFVTEKMDDGSAIPWHKLLSLPPKQMIVIDRMHSGARRFITLDFGLPIMLTDVVS